jgi:hypothetical protein
MGSCGKYNINNNILFITNYLFASFDGTVNIDIKKNSTINIDIFLVPLYIGENKWHGSGSPEGFGKFVFGEFISIKGKRGGVNSIGYSYCEFSFDSS